jgi:vanillate O-demethylase monooxygenase subunit
MSTPLSVSTRAGLIGRYQPRQAWYVAAAAGEVGRALLSRRVADQPLVLFRTTAGAAVALRDRCAHRGYPLSLGTLDGDVITAGFHGWRYDAAGTCVRVPSQDSVPLDARVRSYPVYEDTEFVWVWTGSPMVAEVRRPPSGWVSGPEWRTVGESLPVAATATLLLETFADVTHAPFVDPEVSPTVLGDIVPSLQVEVTELGVSFEREYPPAPLADWLADAIGVPAKGQYPQRESGELAGPGVWADRWDIEHEGRTYTLRFAQAVTPVDDRHSILHWRVASNFSADDDALARLRDTYTRYYTRLGGMVETVQQVRDQDGSLPEVNVRADAVGLQVRKIMQELAAEDS